MKNELRPPLFLSHTRSRESERSLKDCVGPEIICSKPFLTPDVSAKSEVGLSVPNEVQSTNIVSSQLFRSYLNFIFDVFENLFSSLPKKLSRHKLSLALFDTKLSQNNGTLVKKKTLFGGIKKKTAKNSS